MRQPFEQAFVDESLDEQILALDFSLPSNRIAACGGRQVQIWDDTSNGEFIKHTQTGNHAIILYGEIALIPKLASPHMAEYIISAVAFLNEGASLLMCELESHVM